MLCFSPYTNDIKTLAMILNALNIRSTAALLPILLLLAACNGKQQQGKPVVTDTTGFVPVNLQTDTLQYLMEGENEDNHYGLFLTKTADTVAIVWDRPSGLQSSAMFYCEWEEKEITSGGDSEVKYKQAYMKSFKPLNIKPFVNHINPELRRLRYLFYSNGGLVGYFNDGTVVGCPRCDPYPGSVERMLQMQPMGTYVVLDDGSLLIDGSRKEYPEEKKEWNEWMIFNSDAEWENFMNDKDDLTSEQNQRHLMQFLNGYIKLCNQNKNLKETMNWVLASTDVTDGFKSAYQQFYRENPEPDFDPVLSAQDCPEKIELQSIGLRDYYFTFTISENKEDLLVTKVKRAGDIWLVDGCGVINIPEEKINR
ncbi:hypothetical protein F0919_08875 [Taibaiella lutea]|uniref:DUF3828 domain-containing protein n=1 Tax=Taibaiella lutea TaxID=2608001 RepID=A0A5M6CI26_9BACT|nr:hypothetical protein [Taibaiella lutea]KAA5534717.1 hypothetical protein F0919_08875 [Taibaiella lutea]